MPAVPETLPGASVLDGPPPNPALEQGSAPGPSPSFSQMAGGGPAAGATAPTQLTPEILKGMLEAAEGMAQTYDSFAQVTPQLAPDWAMAKDALLNAMAKVTALGAPPVTPNAVGGNFPGGGIDRGGMSAATGGI